MKDNFKFLKQEERHQTLIGRTDLASPRLTELGTAKLGPACFVIYTNNIKEESYIRYNKFVFLLEYLTLFFYNRSTASTYCPVCSCYYQATRILRSKEEEKMTQRNQSILY